jgi:two-component system OmpR family response regulator
MSHLKTVLYVDDDRDVRAIAVLGLNRDGDLAVTSRASGVEALEIARRVRPDLILLDYLMPDLDGPDALERLRVQPETADIPVIFVTTIGLCNDVERFRPLGLIGLIEKPFRITQLLDNVRALWDDRGAR